ncbi:MAG: hypothetical protein IKZ13_08510 [Akkermansia sp.]|nr:hypothetical protein [Akkermansia sp.]
MAGLNEKQKAFARLLVAGVAQAKAYRQVFGSEGKSAVAIRTDACRLAKNAQVLQYVATLSQRADVRAVLSRQERMERLSQAMVLSQEAGNFGDMVRCCAELNKMDGAYTQPDGVQVNVQQGVALADVVAAVMGVSR